MNVLQGITYICGNEADARDVFDIGPAASEVESGTINPEMYRDVLAQMLDKYDIKMGTITVRRSHSAFHNDWSGTFHDGKEFYVSPCYHIKHIVDRLGAGDAFAGAMIFGILTGKSSQDAVNFAAAASCLKHSIPGALNLISVQEVEDVMRSGGAGRVKR